MEGHLDQSHRGVECEGAAVSSTSPLTGAARTKIIIIINVIITILITFVVIIAF